MNDHTYLPAIDGLRAVAVLAVIANHLAAAILPGGYLGVDVFFVISGFVITRSLLLRQDVPAGRLMVDFYARRIKRLLPALVLVVLVGTLLIRLFDPSPMRSTVTGVLALVGASNIFLFSEAIDYFGGSAELNIFTHTWSLGVEEQFYLVYPLLFCLTARGGASFRVAVLAVLSLTSVVAFVLVSKINQPAAYFLTPFRFWELGLGCLAALLIGWPPTHVMLKRWVPVSLPFAATLLTFAMPEAWTIAATLIAVFSTTVLLAKLASDPLPYRPLSVSPMVYMGRISYSLYLWHWLVICLSIWTIGIHWWTVPFQLAIIFAASAFSYRFVEQPLRYGPWMGSGWRSIATGGALVVLSVAVIGVGQRNNIPRFMGTAAEAATQKTLTPGYVGSHSGRQIDACRPSQLFDAAAGTFHDWLVQCRAGVADPLIVFMGDSQAMDLFAMADLVASRGEASVLNIAQNGCRAPPLPGEPPYCNFQSALIGWLAKNDAKSLLVLRNNYNPRRIDGSLGRFMAELTVLLDKAKTAGVRVVYVAPAPKYAAVGPKSLCSLQWFRPTWAIGARCKSDLMEVRAEQQARRSEFLDALQSVQRERDDFLLFDPFDTLCGPDATVCTPMRNGRLIYRDEAHLTEEGSEMLAEPFLAALRSAGWLPAR